MRINVYKFRRHHRFKLVVPILETFFLLDRNYMSHESREDVPDTYCGTPLKGGGYCGLFHLNIYFDDISERCRHHLYLDGKEAVEKYEEARK